MAASDMELDALENWAIAEEKLSVMRHDLRNRLGSMRNASFYLSRRTQKTELWTTDARVPTFYTLIDEQLNLAEEILAHQASFVEFMPRAFSSTTLKACVQRALQTALAPSFLQLAMQLDSVTSLQLCEAEVALAVRCLLHNAFEAVPAGAQGGTVTVRCFDRDQEAVLQVTDNGPGIAPENASKALLPFTTDKQGHRGIGLNIVRRVSQRAKARFNLEAVPSGGLLAELAFPIQEPPA